MRRALRAHPATDRGAVVRIEADIRRRRPRTLVLAYELAGDPGKLRIPARAPPMRADGLWRRTCFEAFLMLEDGGYLELNLSPSGRWAAYRFEGYRAGMAPLEPFPAPKIAFARTAEGLTLNAALELPELPGLSDNGPWRLGLAAVIEDADGNIGYWALAHPPGKPDFHHADSFACEVRAPEAP